MGMREDVMAVQKQVQELKEQSFAYEILRDYKKQNKRLFVILIIVLCMWFATIGAFIYYINTTGYETVTEEVETDNGGNACIGDSCNNGEINYGESKKNN